MELSQLETLLSMIPMGAGHRALVNMQLQRCAFQVKALSQPEQPSSPPTEDP